MTAGISLMANETVPNSCLRFAAANFFNKGEDTYDYKTIEIGDNSRLVHAFGIYDGHNGPEGSIACKSSLLEYIESECAELQREADENETGDWPAYLDTAIRNAFKKVDTDVRSTCDAGTTATVCLIREHESGRVFLKTASVGDSRAVAGDGFDSKFDLTTDHKVSDQEERVRITICEICNSQEDPSIVSSSGPSHEEIVRNRKLSSFQSLKDLSVHGVWPGNVSPRSNRILANGAETPEDSSDDGSEGDMDELRSASSHLTDHSDCSNSNAGGREMTSCIIKPQGGTPYIRTVSNNGEEIKIQPLTNPRCRQCQHRKPFIGRFVDSQGRSLSQDRVFCTDSLLSTNLSRSIGARELSSAITHEPEIMDTTFKTDSRSPFSIVMATDGVWDALSSQRANNCIRRRMTDPSKAAMRIVTKAKQERFFQGHRPDDITALVIFISSPCSSRSESPRSDSSTTSGGRIRRFFGGLCVRD